MKDTLISLYVSISWKWVKNFLTNKRGDVIGDPGPKELKQEVQNRFSVPFVKNVLSATCPCIYLSIYTTVAWHIYMRT
jgi:hypothetical protein